MRHLAALLCGILILCGFGFLWLDCANYALACFYTCLAVFAFVDRDMRAVQCNTKQEGDSRPTPTPKDL